MLSVLATTSRLDDAYEQRPRIVVADVPRDPVPGDAADARAHDLDADHQRVVSSTLHASRAELGPGLRIGRDAARVVVRGAGDQPGAETLEEAMGAPDHGRAP